MIYDLTVIYAFLKNCYDIYHACLLQKNCLLVADQSMNIQYFLLGIVLQTKLKIAVQKSKNNLKLIFVLCFYFNFYVKKKTSSQHAMELSNFLIYSNLFKLKKYILEKKIN